MAADSKTERSERAEVPAVPLYQQVMDDLKGEIARGVYPAGSRIPAEMELAKSYGVGRITVRRAIEELSRAGYLNRQQGRGTFVCAPKLKRKIRQKGDVQSFTEGCAANDMVPGARLVSRTVVAATHEDAAFFGVEPGCELIVVERVRTADGIPVMLENNAFVLADHPYLQTLADEERTMVFYESPYRVVKCLEQFAEVFGPERRVSVSRELTKKFEQTVRGTVAEVLDHFRTTEPKGELSLIHISEPTRRS